MTRACVIAIVFSACATAQPVIDRDGARPLDEHHATRHRTPADGLRRASYVRFHMERSLDDLRAIQLAIVSGDLEAARARAALVARPAHDPGLAAWSDAAAAMIVAASSLAQAPTIDAAPARAASLATACRSCHVRAGAVLALPASPAPTGRMAVHAWALDRMLDGLVAADDHSWRAGLDTLAEPSMSPRLEQLARDATATNDRSPRVYADVLATCAACHAHRPMVASGMSDAPTATRGPEMQKLPSRLAVAALAVTAPATAHAGRTYFGWLNDTETVPAHGVELESKLDERNVQLATVGDRMATWWFAPVVGITDQLELALPIESQWVGEDNPSAGFVSGSLAPRRYGAELRYRLVAQDPTHPALFAPLLRVAVKRDVTGAAITEADAVLSFTSGRIHAVADAGIMADFATSSAFSQANGSRHAEFYPGLGCSIRTIDELRVGAELFGVLTLDANQLGPIASHPWAVVGPNVAWSHGRFWLSAVYGFGVYGIRSAPRVVWGVVL